MCKGIAYDCGITPAQLRAALVRGLVTVLNIQAAGYVFGGLLIIVLLPREKEAPLPPQEPAIADQASMEPERI